MNPYFINSVLGGFVNGESYLCQVDYLGTKFEKDFAL